LDSGDNCQISAVDVTDHLFEGWEGRRRNLDDRQTVLLTLFLLHLAEELTLEDRRDEAEKKLVGLKGPVSRDEDFLVKGLYKKIRTFKFVGKSFQIFIEAHFCDIKEVYSLLDAEKSTKMYISEVAFSDFFRLKIATLEPREFTVRIFRKSKKELSIFRKVLKTMSAHTESTGVIFKYIFENIFIS
jgi:hypothetical protein